MGWVSALDGNGRTVWVVDAHRDGKRFLVRADEKLTAFVELERAIYEFAVEFDLVKSLCRYRVERKRGRMHVRMNPQKTTVAILVVVNRALFASLVFTVGVASAQAPDVTFVSPCECIGFHGIHRWVTKTDQDRRYVSLGKLP